MGLRGKQLERRVVKETAIFVVQNTHAEDLRCLGFEPAIENLKKHQDIVDAILIGRAGLSWIQTAHRGGLALEEYFDRTGKRRAALRG
jgi:hypothetical protein